MKKRVALPLVPAPTADLGAIILRALEDRWAALRKPLQAAQKKASGSRVHGLRVALRRMASVFALIEEVVGGKPERRLRRKIERLLELLGDARDAHVQRKAVAQMARRFPALTSLRDRLGKRERKLADQAERALRKVDVASLQACFEEVAAVALLALSSPVLMERQRRTLFEAVNRRFARLIDRRRALDVADLGTMHAMRVAFKKFRYMVEVLQPILIGMGKAQLDSMQAFQSMMGDVRDLDVLNRRVAAWRSKRGNDSVALVAAQDDIGRRLLQKTDALVASADEIHAFWNQSYLPVAD